MRLEDSKNRVSEQLIRLRVCSASVRDLCLPVAGICDSKRVGATSPTVGVPFMPFMAMIAAAISIPPVPAKIRSTARKVSRTLLAILARAKARIWTGQMLR